MANDIEVSVGYQDIQTLRRELVGVAKDAKTSATTFEREFNKVERVLKANAKASQTYYNSVLKLDQASKSASSSASVFVKALEKEEQSTKRLAIEKDNLAKSFVPLYAQSKLYEEELDRLNKAQQLGVISDAQRERSLESLNNQFAAGTGIFSKYASEASRRTNQTGVAIQQLGYQVGDFAVQVQSGTNAFVAFGQQATQLVGVLPLIHTQLGISMMAAIGLSTGLGIAIPVLSGIAAYFSRTSEKAKETVDVFEKLVQATRQLYIERMKLSDPKFDENLEGTKDRLKELNTAYEEATKRVEELSLAQSHSGNTAGASGVAFANLIATWSQEAALAAQEKAKAELDAYNIEKTQLLIKQTQATLDEQSAKQRIAYQDAYFQKLREEAEIRKEISDKIGEAYLSAIGLQQEPMDAGINKAAAAAQVLAERLGISLNAARNIVALEAGKGFQAKDYSNQTFGGALADMRLAGSSTPPVIKEAIVSGGGGGSRVAQIKETTIALDKETEANKRLEENMNAVSSNMTSAFMAMVEGSDSVVGAFRNMMYNILKSIYEQNVAKPLGNSISSLLFAGLSGGGPQTGSMGLPNFRFADGGVVGSPTTFQMSGGKTGLMGEAGPEAIMPLKRGSNGQLGVQVNGGSGGTTVNNNITVTGSDAAAVRMEVAKMIPQITNATKAAIIDAKRRGGQMGAAFN